jgi:DNA-binding transcriptional LysR family regulator
LSSPENQEQSAIRFPGRSTWPGVELRHLVALQAVVAAGSFNSAAARLGYTQSAVSAQIRTLERLVGARLLDRSRGVKGVRLTKDGTILLHYATEIVARFESAAEHLLEGRNQMPEELRVGTFPSTSQAILPEVLRRFAAAQPQIEVVLTERYDEDLLLDLLESGSIDLAFAVLPTRGGPFATSILCHEEHVALVPRGDPLGRRGSVLLTEVAVRPLVADASRHAARHLQGIRAAGSPTVWELQDATAIAAFVAAGLGVGLAPAFTSAARSDVEAVRLRSTIAPRTLAIAWHRERVSSPAVSQFVGIANAVSKLLHVEQEPLQGDRLPESA